MPNPYRRAGYEDRESHLAGLARDNAMDEQRVAIAADLLGPNEDFDGLVTRIENEDGRHETRRSQSMGARA